MDDDSSIVKQPFVDHEAELYSNLVKVGDDLNISRIDPALRRLGVGVGWDIIGYQASEMDVDVSAFFLDTNNKTVQDDDFIFYNNPRVLEGAVTHNGDNRTGAGDGDDESMSFLLTGIPFTVTRIAFTVTIYKSYERELNLGMVRNLYIRLFNEETEDELTRFLLSKEFVDNNDGGAVVGFLDREGPDWHFKPQLDFAHKGLSTIAKEYGIIIKEE